MAALLNNGPARRVLASEQLHAPHLVDSEVANSLRRRVSTALLKPEDAWKALDAWRRLGLARYPVIGMIERVWLLRDNLSAYDASYVALAEQLGCDCSPATDASVERLACDVRSPSFPDETAVRIDDQYRSLRTHRVALAPSDHQTVVTLEARGLVTWVPGKARSIRVLAVVDDSPALSNSARHQRGRWATDSRSRP